MNKPTLVIGASNNPSRYAYKAVDFLKSNNFHPIFPMGVKKGEVLGIEMIPPKTKIDEDIHTVTLYVNPMLQKEYYDYIIDLKPNRVIFNPGTENEEFSQQLNKNGIETINACTLVMINTNQY